jgi:uncharacterized damage-inducible protein DinB
MRLAFNVLGVIASSTVWAQSFDPKMPESVPAVSGSIFQSAPLHYIDVSAGTGAPAAAGQEYTVHYTGWLRDGTKFDSSRDRNEPIKFVQGRRQVIAGWETGFEGMKVGGKRRLFIPYQLAYGEKGSGSIPAKAELIFDVELLDAKDVPERAPASDILLAFSDIEMKVIRLAKEIPADKYDWRPTPEVRSIREVFMHIVFGNKLLLAIALKQPTADELQLMIRGNASNEKQPVSRDAVWSMLTMSFYEVRKELETIRAGRLAGDAEFFGQTMTVRGILMKLSAHAAEHLGQLIAYARMNGIKPPWSGE